MNWWYINDPKLGKIARWKYCGFVAIIFLCIWLDELLNFLTRSTQRAKLFWWSATSPRLRRLKKLAGIK